MLELEHEVLAEQFEALLRQEQQVEESYAGLAQKVTDPAALADIKNIHRDKQRHIQLAQRLLEIVD